MQKLFRVLDYTNIDRSKVFLAEGQLLHDLKCQWIMTLGWGGGGLYQKTLLCVGQQGDSTSTCIRGEHYYGSS